MTGFKIFVKILWAEVRPKGKTLNLYRLPEYSKQIKSLWFSCKRMEWNASLRSKETIKSFLSIKSLILSLSSILKCELCIHLFNLFKSIIILHPPELFGLIKTLETIWLSLDTISDIAPDNNNLAISSDKNFLFSGHLGKEIIFLNLGRLSKNCNLYPN